MWSGVPIWTRATIAESMTRTVNVEVYCDTGANGEKDIFAVAGEHRPDLPKSIDGPLQEWAKANFEHLEKGDSLKEAGKLVYKPNGEIVEIKSK